MEMQMSMEMEMEMQMQMQMQIDGSRSLIALSSLTVPSHTIVCFLGLCVAQGQRFPSRRICTTKATGNPGWCMASENCGGGACHQHGSWQCNQPLMSPPHIGQQKKTCLLGCAIIIQTSFHTCKRTEAKPCVPWCCWVNPYQLSVWDLSLLLSAALPQEPVPVLLGLVGGPLQRSTSKCLLPFAAGSTASHSSHQLLPSLSPVPIVFLSQSRNEGNRTLPVTKGLCHILKELIPICLSGSMIPDPSLFHVLCSKPIHQALTGAELWVWIPSWHQKGVDCFGAAGVCRHFWWSRQRLQTRFRSKLNFQLQTILKWSSGLNLG